MAFLIIFKPSNTTLIYISNQGCNKIPYIMTEPTQVLKNLSNQT